MFPMEYYLTTRPNLHVSPGLAAVRAGVNGDAAARAGSTLSPKKLIKMTDNFSLVQAWVDHFVTPQKCTYHKYA